MLESATYLIATASGGAIGEYHAHVLHLFGIRRPHAGDPILNPHSFVRLHVGTTEAIFGRIGRYRQICLPQYGIRHAVGTAECLEGCFPASPVYCTTRTFGEYLLIGIIEGGVFETHTVLLRVVIIQGSTYGTGADPDHTFGSYGIPIVIFPGFLCPSLTHILPAHAAECIEPELSADGT